ncbi:MAG TPA: hypothetical protein PK496_00895 [Bacteroidales bacterium]|nr:hypothetical protein [Bacteroidales bacterium]
MLRTSVILFLAIGFLVSCSKDESNTLKVITFNIRYDNPRDSINA